MKQCIIVGCALIAAWTVPAVASAQAEHVKDSRKAEFNLESAIVVGHQRSRLARTVSRAE